MNRDITPLNLQEIISNIYKFSDGKTRMKDIREHDTLLSFEPYSPQKYVSYKAEDLNSGTTQSVSGNMENGYIKETQFKNDPIIEVRTYYGNCKLASIGRKFVQKHTSLPGIEYPVGLTEKYDQTGKLIKVIDQNKVFKFSYKDVVHLLVNDDKDVVIGSAIAKEYDDGTAFWEVDFNSPSKGRSNIRIDGYNGKVLRESHHIKLITD